MSEERFKKLSDDYYNYWLKKAEKTLEAHDELYAPVRIVSKGELQKLYRPKKWWQFWK